MTIIKDIIYFLINYVLCYVPSRTVRKYFYHLLSGKKISLRCSIAIGVKILDIRNVSIGDNTNINHSCIIDGRGAAIVIGSNVDIAPQVNIWTMQHSVSSSHHESESFPVKINDRAWVANRAIILPGTIINCDAVVAAGVTFKGVLEPSEIVVSGKNYHLDKKRKLANDFQLEKVRRFR